MILVQDYHGIAVEMAASAAVIRTLDWHFGIFY